MSSDLARAYVLSRRDFRETSAIVGLLVEDGGRIDAVARGARSKRGPTLEPFTPLAVSFRGRAELKNLVVCERAGPSFPLFGDMLYSGFYLNELLVRGLSREDPTPGLFETYEKALAELASGSRAELEPALRRFEFRLLELLGYGLNLAHASDTGAPITAGTAYVVPLAGVFETRPDVPHVAAPVEVLAKLCRREFDSAEVLALAKRVARRQIDALVGGRPLKSRELFGRGGGD